MICDTISCDIFCDIAHQLLFYHCLPTRRDHIGNKGLTFCVIPGVDVHAMVLVLMFV